MFTADFWNIEIGVFTKIKLLWAPVMGSFQLLGQTCKWKCSNEKTKQKQVQIYIFFQRQIRRPCRRGCCGYLLGWYRTTTGTSDDGARSSLNFNWTIFGYLYCARCLQVHVVPFALRHRETLITMTVTRVLTGGFHCCEYSFLQAQKTCSAHSPIVI